MVGLVDQELDEYDQGAGEMPTHGDDVYVRDGPTTMTTVFAKSMSMKWTTPYLRPVAYSPDIARIDLQPDVCVGNPTGARPPRIRDVTFAVARASAKD